MLQLTLCLKLPIPVACCLQEMLETEGVLAVEEVVAVEEDPEALARFWDQTVRMLGGRRAAVAVAEVLEVAEVLAEQANLE